MNFIQNALYLYIEAVYSLIDKLNPLVSILAPLAWALYAQHFLPTWVTYANFALITPLIADLIAMIYIAIHVHLKSNN